MWTTQGWSKKKKKKSMALVKSKKTDPTDVNFDLWSLHN